MTCSSVVRSATALRLPLWGVSRATTRWTWSRLSYATLTNLRYTRRILRSPSTDGRAFFLTLAARQGGNLASESFRLPRLVAKCRLLPPYDAPIHDFTGPRHGPPQHPHAVCQQTAVCWIVNMGLYQRTVGP